MKSLNSKVTRVLVFSASEELFNVYRRSTYKRLCSMGYSLNVACELDNTPRERRLEEVDYFNLHFPRASLNPWRWFRFTTAIRRLVRELAPTVIISYSVNLSFIVSLATLSLPIKKKIAVFTGMGYLFTGVSIRARCLKNIYCLLSKWVYANSKICVLNDDDRALVAEFGFGKETCLLSGEGIEVRDYPRMPVLSSTPFTITYVGRMLRDKGIRELVAAGDQLVKEGLNLKIRLVGMPDYKNPNSVSASEWQEFRKMNFLECIGYQHDIRGVWRSSHIAALLSYREGLPQCLLEAALCDRALLASNVPGCRRIVEHEVTGLLVNPRDSLQAAQAIRRLMNDSALREKLAQHARRKVEDCFSSDRVSSELNQLFQAGQ